MKNGPSLWDRILTPVREAFPSAIMAGGCVRDFLMGDDMPKDFDIFVNASREEMEAGRDQLRTAGLKVDFLHHNSLTEYEQNPDWKSEVTGVLDGYMQITPGTKGEFYFDAEWANVQIIGRPSADFRPEALVQRFDFGLTQCWYDGRVMGTEAAYRDLAAKTATLLRRDTPTHVVASRRRFDRWNDRWPGRLTLVIPERNPTPPA